MERVGEVVEARGGQLLVQFCRPSDCEKCGACHGRKVTELLVDGVANVGDVVTVAMPTAQLLKASTLAYTVPLAGLMLGLFIGTLVAGEQASRDLISLAGGVIGLGVSLLIVLLGEKRRQKDANWTPKLVGVCPKETEYPKKQEEI